MATYRIAVLPGDGIGQEVTPQAVRVLQSVGKGTGVHFELEQALCGGCAIDATGHPLPPTAPNRIACALLQSFKVAGGNGCPVASMAQPPHRACSNSKWTPVPFPTDWSTRTA